MSRRKSIVVSPKPATLILRRSARLKNRDSQRKPGVDLVLCSEPPKKARREILRELSKRLVYSLDTSIDDSSSKKSSGSNGFHMLRRSLRLSSSECSDANKEKPFSAKPVSTPSSKKPFSAKHVSTPSSKKLSFTKPASTSSSNKLSSTKPVSTSSSKKLSSMKPASTISSKKPSSMKLVSTSSSKKLSSTKPASTISSKKPSSMKPVSTSSSKKPSSKKPASNISSKKLSSTKPASTSSAKKPSSTKPASTSSSKKPSSAKPATVSSSCTLRRSPRFLSGGGSVNQSSSSGRKSVNQSSPSDGKRSVNQSSSSNGSISGISVLSRCSTKSISSKKRKGGDGLKSRDRNRSLLPRTNMQMSRGCYDEQEVGEEEELSGCHSEKKRMRTATPDEEENAVSKANKGKRLKKEVSTCLSDNKRMRLAIANEEGNAVSKANEGKRLEKEEDRSCLSEKKRVRIAKPNEEGNAVSKANKGKMIEKEEDEGLETKQKLEKSWTEELELALQGAYLTVKPSPNFWKKVAKMVPGKSAQECFDRVNSSLITPRQAQPRRARKSNLSPIPQFSISASKLLKPNSPKNKIRQRRKHLSKKMVRNLLEKQNHMDQDHGYDLFSVLEPNTTSNILATPTEKGPSLPIILESPMPCTRFSNKEQTTLVSPLVLKQVKNKALHEKYIDHLHIREAKRKVESTRLAGKENIRPIDIQKDMVRAAKDSLLFNVQDAIQKLKCLECENTPSSSEFCDDVGETDEDESI